MFNKLFFRIVYSFILMGFTSVVQATNVEVSTDLETSISKRDKHQTLVVYRIAKLSKGESLKLMKHPTDHSPVVDFLPYDARWIIPKSEKKRYGILSWQEVQWNGRRGWAKSDFLILDPVATKAVSADKSCLEKNRLKHCLKS